MAYVKCLKMWALLPAPMRRISRNMNSHPHSLFHWETISVSAAIGNFSTKALPTPIPVSSVQARHYGTFGSSIFHHDENMNAVRILQNLPNYKGLMFEYDERIMKGEEIRAQAEVSSQGNRSVTAGPTFKPSLGLRNSVLSFIDIAYASQDAQLTITHPKYEDVVKGVMGELRQLTDNELCQVLYHAQMFSPCPSSRDPPYLKIWKELDKECLTRSPSWSVDFCFVVADLWYGLGLARLSEFHWGLLKRLFRKCDKLRREHFVRFMFCLNLNREIPPNSSAYDLEYSVQRHADLLTAEEIVIVAMAFFKTQKPVRDPKLVEKLLRTVMKESKSLESVSVAAIAKLTRYSTDGRSGKVVYDLQEAFLPEVARLSNSACTHLALAGTNSLAPHKELVKAVVDRIQEGIVDARLKELERITLAATMFNVDCDQLCKDIAAELQQPERADEIRKYGRCLPAILHYLSFKNIFIPDLMSMCLSKAFRDTYYGKGREIFQRELLCLDVAADIEVPDYAGNRLDEKSYNLIMKKNMLWVKPLSKLRVSTYEKFVRNVTEVFHDLLEDKELFHVCTILPQHHTMTVVYCRNKEGSLVQIPQYYFEISPHLIKKVQIDPEFNYHALILCGRSLYLWNKKDLTGQANLQIRQTEKLGYKTQLVYLSDWEALPNLSQRRNHIQSIIT